MSPPHGRDSVGELAVSRVAEGLGLDAVATELGRPSAGPYLYLGAWLVVDLGVLSGIQYVWLGYHPLLVSPGAVVSYTAAAFGIWATRHLAQRYDAIATTQAQRATDPAPLRRPLAPLPLQVGMYLLFVAIALIWLSRPGVTSAILAVEGPIVGPIKLGSTWLLLWYPIVAEVAAVIVGIHLLLPRRLVQAGIELDFNEPDRLGGLRPVGQLVQRSTQVFYLGLLAYTILILLTTFPSIPGPSPGPFLSGVFALAWVGGFLLFLVPVVWLHRLMKRQKRNHIEEVHREIVGLGTDDALLPTVSADDDEVLRYLYLQAVLDRAERTREFPTNPSLVRDLGLSSLPSIVIFAVSTFV